MIKPIPFNIGVGVSSMEEHPEYVSLGYQAEQAGRYWNYRFTTRNWNWPEPAFLGEQYVIDGFSPNLNKELHIGHLRNLAVATSLSRIHPSAKMVAMLGAAVGIEPLALEQLDEWYQFTGYLPDMYYDTQLPDNVESEDGEGDQAGCKVWHGPKGPIIVTRSDGRHTYAHHDLSFIGLVGPTHYVTGAEQKEHFESLGIGDKHLPMGLVLGADGKKISSRSGEAMTAREALTEVANHLEDTPQPEELAWNVVAWNFLKTTRPKNVMFNPEEWTKNDSPGMYISYTFARVHKALKGIVGDVSQVTDQDVRLLGAAAYKEYYLARSQELMDASPLANYTLDLAKEITRAYHSEKIIGGRPGFQFAIQHANLTLSLCMHYLGMKPLQEV